MDGKTSIVILGDRTRVKAPSFFLLFKSLSLSIKNNIKTDTVQNEQNTA